MRRTQFRSAGRQSWSELIKIRKFTTFKKYQGFQGWQRLSDWACVHTQGFLGGPVVKNLPANAGNRGSIRSPGRSHRLWSNEAREPQVLSPRSGPGSLNCWAHVPWSLCSTAKQAPQWEARAPRWRAHMPWSLCSTAKQAPQWEAHAPRWSVAPTHHNWRKAHEQQWRPAQPKNKTNKS